MRRHKPIGFLVAGVIALLSGSAARPDTATEPVPPGLTPLDQRFVTRCVRRMLEDHAREGAGKAPAYVPPELAARKCQVLVTLREGGLHRGTGISQPAPILDACREAVVLAAGRVATTGTVDLDLVGRLTIEVEAAGEPVPLDITADRLLAGPVEAYVEAGIHGLRLTVGDRSVRLCPSQLVAHNTPLSKAVVELASKLTASPDELKQAKVFRFRTTHWVELRPGGDVIELCRGMVPVPLEAVTSESLDAAVSRLADYLAYRQLPTGRFTCVYMPADDKYTEADDEAAQAEAAWAVCAAARRNSGKAASAADRAAGWLAGRIVGLTGHEGAGFVRTPDDANKLSVTALTCLALTDHPRADDSRAKRDLLIGGMLWLQRPDGRFLTAFPPAEVLGTQETAPGLALLALARAQEQAPQQRIMKALDSALPFYRELFTRNPSPDFAAWHIQAFARMARLAKRDDFAAFVFAMADALVAVQLNESNCPWPDKWGGFAPAPAAMVGAASAPYLSALCEALVLARGVKDADRTKRYERTVRLGARLILQLSFRPEETYYVRSTKDTVGGIRTTLIDDTIRIDYCAEAMLALMRATETMEGETSKRGKSQSAIRNSWIPSHPF